MVLIVDIPGHIDALMVAVALQGPPNGRIGHVAVQLRLGLDACLVAVEGGHACIDLRVVRAWSESSLRIHSLALTDVVLLDPVPTMAVPARLGGAYALVLLRLSQVCTCTCQAVSMTVAFACALVHVVGGPCWYMHVAWVATDLGDIQE